MAKRHRKTQKSQINLQEFVVVTFAEDIEQAKDYETLLKTNDIPALVKEQHQSHSDETKGIAVLVPEDFLDEAHVIIESQDAYEDFYDFASEDKDEDEDEDEDSNDFNNIFQDES